MFGVQQRDRVRARLLELAEADPAVVAVAITGSHATAEEDRWSDIDPAFAVDGEPAEVLGRWTELLGGEFGTLHHWDLPFGSAIYRVFLLPGGLEVDLAFTPVAEFGPRGPAWRTVSGATVRPGRVRRLAVTTWSVWDGITFCMRRPASAANSASWSRELGGFRAEA
jgi:hypothetical protein